MRKAFSLAFFQSNTRVWRTELARAFGPADGTRPGAELSRFELKGRARVFIIIALALALAIGWGGGGCASAPGKSSAPKPGSGIAEYREVTREAHSAVAATVKSLESLASPHAQPMLEHPALPGFDRAFHQLELTSVKARARAEAIITRGQVYFEEWKGNLSTVTNQAAAETETVRYIRLYGHFERVRQRSGEVRKEFRPFMAKLREFRARLDHPAAAPSGAALQQETRGLITDGQRVLQTLESVSTALNDAETELRASLAEQTMKGDRP